MTVTSKSFANTAVSSIEALRQATEAAFVTAEERASGDDMPVIEWLDQTGGAPTAAGGDILLYGRDLLAGGDFDTISLDDCGTSVDLNLYAMKPGDSGITVQVIAGTGTLSVAFSSTTKLLAITLASGGSTDDAVATAVNADASQCNGYVRAVSGGGGTLTLDMAATAMSGGVGDWDKFGVFVSGVECLPANTTGTNCAAKWADTSIACTVPALTGESPARAATDLVQIRVLANGCLSDAMTTPLA